VRQSLLFPAAGIWLALAVVPVIAGNPGPSKQGTCGSYGTSVEFVSTPSEAARLAKKDQKLVFVLHVSGHFEDPQFT